MIVRDKCVSRGSTLSLSTAGDVIFATSASDHAVGAWLVQGSTGLVCADTMRDGESVHA